MIDRIRRALPKKLFLTEFHSNNETFEKCSILFKFKEGKNFNHLDEIIYRDRHPYIEYFED